jgi:glycosyltransferase involved in cell wall biosynthesis
MRILQVLGRSEGGVAKHVARLVELLSNHGLDVAVAAPGALRSRFDSEFHPVAIPAGAVSGHVRAIRSLRALIVAGRFSVVHGHGLRAGLDTVVGGRLSGVGRVVTLHNVVQAEVVGRYRAFLGRPAESLLMRLADRVYVASSDMAQRLERDPRPSRLELWPVGVEAPPVTRPKESVRHELSIPATHKVVVTVARLAPQKAINVLLEAAAKLPDVVVVIAGEGPLKSALQEKAESLGIAERVRWLGHVAQVGDVMAAADVFCLSSTWEARSLAAQEAILLGVPVVSTAVGGMTDLIEDRRSGRLVPPGDSDALATALKDVLQDSKSAARYAAEAVRALKMAPSEIEAVEGLVKTYSELASA